MSIFYFGDYIFFSIEEFVSFLHDFYTPEQAEVYFSKSFPRYLQRRDYLGSKLDSEFHYSVYYDVELQKFIIDVVD